MCVYVCVLTSCLVFTVVDFLSDGAESHGLLDDVIVVGDLSSGGHRQVRQCPGECDVCVHVCVYLCPGNQLHEGPAVFVSDQLDGQLLAGRHLVDAMVPARGASAGRRRGRG